MMANDGDEDEDVDLEHSALYKYMHEQGLVECEQRKDVREEGDGRKTKASSTSSSFWTRISDKFLKTTSTLLSYFKSELLLTSARKTLVEYYLHEHRKVILNSRALMEDDANFLENFLDPFVQPPSTMVVTSKYMFLGLDLKIIVAPVILIFAYSCAKFQSEASVFNNSLTITEGIFISTISAYVLLQLSKRVIFWRKKKSLMKSLSQVTEYVHESESFLKSAQKCLNYIQELEVIGRGLILTTAGTSASKMEQSELFPRLQSLPNGCLCTSLRVCLFTCLRERFNATKESTMQLIYSYPLKKEIDNGHYIAYIANQELGALLSFDVGKDELSNSTERLSVSTIKEMGQLFGLQLSEFLRRLALCYYPEFKADTKSPCAENFFKIPPQIIKSLCMKVRDASNMLNDNFQFHRKSTRERKVPNKGSASVIQSVMTSQRALVTAMNSLALHMQVSISRIEDFTDVLENTDDICKCTVATHANEHQLNLDAYHKLNDQLELIKQDLHACTLCWEESSLRLHKLCPNREECGNLEIPAIAQIENSPDCSSGIPLLVKTDIAPEDQIFEAYVDESEMPNEDGDSYWDLELRKKTAEERNISKRMFTELKTVLVPKVEEWQMREARALLASGITEQRSTTPNEKSLDETIKLQQQATENSDSTSNHKITEYDRIKMQQNEPVMPTFSSFNSSIASMAAARSKLLTFNPCETFGDDYCDSDTSSDT